MEETYLPHSEEEAKEDEEMTPEADAIIEKIKELPEEKQEELAEKIQELTVSAPVQTSRHSFHVKLRGVGVTRKNKSKSKKNLKIEKNSRRRNRGK